jgi:alkanesulfonate monooxygenase SsuD/methylene tetrahydromethanopterin reductase-like flavin-dependent oxidoreductase (luciferase family)
VSSRPALRFGLFLGQGGSTWSQVLDRFRQAEDLGFDHAWLVDHMMPTDGPDDRDMLEAWTLLAALTARTERITLGVLVTNNLFRNPALLAKQAATVDQVGGGRLILGLGSGWFEREHRAYGYPVPPARERVDRLEEAVVILRALLGGDAAARITHRGRHYELDDAPFAPRPTKPEGIPLLIAAHRPRMLAIAARYADIWDTFPAKKGTATEGVAADVTAQAHRLEAEARKAGRDPDGIRRSTWLGGSRIGTIADYEDFVRTHVSLGFTDCTIGLPAGGPEVLQEIGRRTLPRLRAEAAAREEERHAVGSS